MHQMLDLYDGLNTSLEVERPRLVGLCARLTGDRESAEDLAQETLLEAWRHLNELRDPRKFPQWLSGIARNVCLRWLRQYGKESTYRALPLNTLDATEHHEQLADSFDLEIYLEQKELVALLDRALALLPAETRSVLVERYVQESPLAEVAGRLGINIHAAAMRLQRGKLALRQVLTTEFSQEIASYSLNAAHMTSADHWEQTSIWCDTCGQQRLQGRYDPHAGKLWLICSGCCSEPEDFMIQTDSLKILGGVKGYKPAFSRVMNWGHEYYRPNLLTLTVPCLLCGRPTRLNKGPSDHPDLTPYQRNRYGLFHRCSYCSSSTSSWASLDFLVLSLPESRRFLKTHPRIRQLPDREVETAGRCAIVTAFESVTNAEQFAVISASDTYEVLSIEGGQQ